MQGEYINCYKILALGSVMKLQKNELSSRQQFYMEEMTQMNN